MPKLLPRLIAGALALHAGHALSQSAPVPAADAPKPAVPAKPSAATATTTAQPAEQGVQQVQVVAERQTNRIDRQVYDVKSDISTTNASAADALNNVPSVQVDPDGSVRLRGNQNVKIMVDGKPSAMLQGDNRGAVLNAMPADFIESIEVVNNPGAEFGNEGGGGPILNLISRRNRRPGGFGHVRGNWGTEGRYNAGVSGSYSAGYASIDSFLSYRHDGRGSRNTTFREAVDPVSGALLPSYSDGVSHGLNGSLFFSSNFRYNVGSADRMGGSMGYHHRGDDGSSLTHYRYLAADGSLSSEQWRDTARSGHGDSGNGSVFYEHKFDGSDDTLKADWRVSRSSSQSDDNAHRSYVLSPFPRPDEYSTIHNEPDTRISDFTVDYVGKVGAGNLVSGIKLADTTQDRDARYSVLDPLTNQLRVNTSLTNTFSANERISAGYAAYEYRFNDKWAAKAGARVEHTALDIHQITSAIEATHSYTNVMPSSYVAYTVDKDTIIRFSYAHRLNRPNVNNLNPYVSYQSPTDRSEGNPQLKPSQSDFFELSYDTKWAGMKTDLRLFANEDRDVVTQKQLVVKDETGQDIVLTTYQNFGTRRSQGLEFVFGGKPDPALTLNLSGNLRHDEQTQFAGLGLPATRSGTSLSGNGRINYQATADDQLQMRLNAQGKQLWAQGYRAPNWTADLTWQRKLSPALTMLVNGTDIFRTNKSETHTDSDLLHTSSLTRYDGRVFYIGFQYQLGGVMGDTRVREGGMRGGPGRPGGPGGPGGGQPM